MFENVGLNHGNGPSKDNLQPSKVTIDDLENGGPSNKAKKNKNPILAGGIDSLNNQVSVG